MTSRGDPRGIRRRALVMLGLSCFVLCGAPTVLAAPGTKSPTVPLLSLFEQRTPRYRSARLRDVRVIPWRGSAIDVTCTSTLGGLAIALVGSNHVPLNFETSFRVFDVVDLETGAILQHFIWFTRMPEPTCNPWGIDFKDETYEAWTGRTRPRKVRTPGNAVACVKAPYDESRWYKLATFENSHDGLWSLATKYGVRFSARRAGIELHWTEPQARTFCVTSSDAGLVGDYHGHRFVDLRDGTITSLDPATVFGGDKRLLVQPTGQNEAEVWELDYRTRIATKLVTRSCAEPRVVRDGPLVLTQCNAGSERSVIAVHPQLRLQIAYGGETEETLCWVGNRQLVSLRERSADTQQLVVYQLE